MTSSQGPSEVGAIPVALEAEIDERWRAWVTQRNRRGATPVLWLVTVLFPLFALLDYLVAPADALPILYASRIAVTVAAAVGFAAIRTRVFSDHSEALTSGFMVLISGGLILMTFVLGGFTSPYYPALNSVMIAAGLAFIWTLRTSIITNAAIMGLYMVPNAFIATREEIVPAITNFFFLGSTAAVVSVGQALAYRSQKDQVTGQALLERANEERQLALAKLQELDRAKSHFFSNITHELRTPLTMILSPLESALTGDIGRFTTDQSVFLKSIWSNALKLLKLINNLLDLAKIEEKHLKLRLLEMDLSELLGEIVEHTRPLASRKDIALELTVQSLPSALWIDPEKMERVIVNLLSNALKFTDRGGSVTVTLAGTDDGGGAITVRDTGIGIPADKLDSVFERFSQGDDSTTRRFGGTGIGLAFAREIVELHGGAISVTSVAGEGSTFSVTLRGGKEHFPPEALTTASADEGAEGGSIDWGQRLKQGAAYRFHDIDEVTERRVANRGDDTAKATKVLVVEDTVEIARFIHIQLQADHAVYIALNGRQGLELAKKERPDLVVTDYMMPEMDGIELVMALRADPTTSEIPIVMLTAKNTVEDRLRARGAGADVYLNKPFSPRELRSVVGKLLEKRGRQATSMMKASVKTLEIISAGLAHEIHNPLSYIKNSHLLMAECAGRIEQALGDPNLAESDRNRTVGRAREKLSRMSSVSERGIQRIEQVVQLVRRYAREGYPEEPSPLDLDEAVRDVCSLLAPKSDKDVSLELTLEAPGRRVLCIAEEFQQVIRNLVQNAIDAVGTSGHVTVRTAVEGETTVLRVVDDGPGIPNELRARIFTPFFTTKGPGKGMGVGLAIVQQVVEQMRGTIEITNNPDGPGACFVVRVPTHQDEPAAAAATREAS